MPWRFALIMANSLSTKWFLACAAATVFFIIGMKIPIGPEFLTGTLLACLIFHLWLRPRKAELTCVAVTAVILTVVRLRFGSAIPQDVGSWMCFLSMVGLSSLLIQSVLLPFAETEFKRRLTTFTSGLACVLFLMFSTAPLLFAAAHTPLTFDLYLLEFDRALGGDISFWLGRIVQSSNVLLYPVAFAYGGLALDVAIVIGPQMFEQRSGRGDLLTVLGAAGAAGCLLYAVVPATGPRFVFPDFPVHLPAVVAPQLIPVNAVAMRNAVPSLHFSWTLLLCWMAKDAEAYVRWVAGAFLILTFIATMALGQHYFVDLVVALPFTMIFIGLFERNYRVAILSATVLCAWFVMLRVFPELPVRLGVWTWLPVLLTVAAFLASLWRILWHRHRRCTPAIDPRRSPAM
jgi:PAP2 superfamily